MTYWFNYIQDGETQREWRLIGYIQGKQAETINIASQKENDKVTGTHSVSLAIYASQIN